MLHTPRGLSTLRPSLRIPDRTCCHGTPLFRGLLFQLAYDILQRGSRLGDWLHSHLVLMYDVPVWFSACPLIHVYKTSYPSLECACGGRAERPQRVYANDNTSLIHQIKFRRNRYPWAHPLWFVELSSTWWPMHLCTWASEINCYFNGQVIGSRRQISLARNVEKHHRFWGARALGSWQSIQIACRLQESVREDTGRRVLHVIRREFTARSHILVIWSVYPNYEYHNFSMCI